MPQPHPLEVPEILALVGSFLPLWVQEKQYPFDLPRHHFKPKTLYACIRVSKLWNRTLLPLLWYIYSSDTCMQYIPPDVISRHSRLCRILLWSPVYMQEIELDSFNCTNLVEASILEDGVGPGGGRGGGGGGGNEGTVGDEHDQQRSMMTPISSGKRMLRANPGLRRVWWAPDGHPLPVPKLDVEDFVGLGNLQELSLLYWDCHDGQLGEVLRIASRSLKKLTACWVKVSRSSELTGSPIPPLSPQLEDSGSEGVTLSQLEYLEWRTNEPSGDFIFELIKRSPRLKTFKFEVYRVEWDFLRLADILRNHCPSFASLICSMELGVQEMENMLRHCSASGLRTVRVSVKDLDNGLIEAILQHASTVENLAISQEQIGTGTDPARILQLLVGCSSLVHFSLVLRRSKFHCDLVNTLREQSWGCQGLQTLELIVVDSEEDRRRAEEEAGSDNEEGEEEKWYDVLATKGWEVPAMVERLRLGDVSTRRVAKTKLYRVLDLIQYQNLDKLGSLRLDNVRYCRSSTRPL